MKAKRVLSLLVVLCMIAMPMIACSDNSTTSTLSVSGGDNAATSSTDDGIFELGDVFTTTSGGSTTITSSGSTTITSSGSTTTTSGGSTTTTESDRTYTKVEDISDLKDYEKAVFKKLPELKTDNEKILTILSNSKMSESPMLGRKYGVNMKITVVPNAELINRYVSSVNAGTPPDIFVSNYNYTLISKGYVQAWDKHTDLKSDMWKDEVPHMDNYAVAGKHYVFVPKDPTDGGRLMYMVYNVDTLKNANVATMPTDLYKQNKWDWDAMIDIAEKTTGNGNYGIWMYNGPQAFVNSTGHDYVDFVNGRAKNMLQDADLVRAVQAFSDLVAKKTYYTRGSELEMLRRGKLAMIVGTEGTVLALKDEIIAGKVAVVAFPRDPKKNKHYMPYMGNGFYLAKDAAHPQNAVAYMTCYHFEQDYEYLKALNAERVAEGAGTPPAIWETLRAIDRNSMPTLQTWDMFGSEATVYISALGTGLVAGSPWSLLSAELNPILNDGIQAFYGG